MKEKQLSDLILFDISSRADFREYRFSCTVGTFIILWIFMVLLQFLIAKPWTYLWTWNILATSLHCSLTKCIVDKITHAPTLATVSSFVILAEDSGYMLVLVFTSFYLTAVHIFVFRLCQMFIQWDFLSTCLLRETTNHRPKIEHLNNCFLLQCQSFCKVGFSFCSH